MTRARPLPRRVRFAGVLLAVVALAAVAGAVRGPGAAARPSDAAGDRLAPPSATHPMGTDFLARDLFSRVLEGTRVSVEIALVAVVVLTLVGAAWGIGAGLAPRRAGGWLMRVPEAILPLPRLLIVLAWVAVTRPLDPLSLGLVLGACSWAPMARVVFERTSAVRATPFVDAARALGTPGIAIAIRHVLPAVWPMILVTAVNGIAEVVPIEASLTFLGAGLAAPTPSWGVLIADATARPLDAWWLVLFPSAVLAATVIGVTILGEHLRRALPAHRQS